MSCICLFRELCREKKHNKYDNPFFRIYAPPFIFIFVFYCKLLLKTTKEEKIFFQKFEFNKFPTISFEIGLALTCLAPEFTTIQWSSSQRSPLQGQHSLGCNPFYPWCPGWWFPHRYAVSVKCNKSLLVIVLMPSNVIYVFIRFKNNCDSNNCNMYTIAKTFKKSTQGTFNSRVRVIYWDMHGNKILRNANIFSVGNIIWYWNANNLIFCLNQMTSCFVNETSSTNLHIYLLDIIR